MKVKTLARPWHLWRNPLLPQLKLPHPLQLVPASRVVNPPQWLPFRHPPLLLRRPLWLRRMTTKARIGVRLRPLLPPLHRPRNQRLPRRQHQFNRLLRPLMLG